MPRRHRKVYEISSNILVDPAISSLERLPNILRDEFDFETGLETPADVKDRLSKASTSHSSKIRIIPVFCSDESHLESNHHNEANMNLLNSSDASILSDSQRNPVFYHIDDVSDSHLSLYQYLEEGKLLKVKEFRSKSLMWSYQLLSFLYFCHSNYICIGPIDSTHVDLVEDSYILNNAYKVLHICKEILMKKESPYRREPPHTLLNTYINPQHWLYLISKYSKKETSKVIYPYSFHIIPQFATTSLGVFEISDENPLFQAFKDELYHFIDKMKIDFKYFGIVIMEIMSGKIIQIVNKDKILHSTFAFEQLDEIINYSQFDHLIIDLLKILFLDTNSNIWKPKINIDNRCGKITEMLTLQIYELLNENLKNIDDYLRKKEEFKLKRNIKYLEETVEWTVEDEAMRIKARERHEEENKRLAEEGKRQAEQRLREERRKIWFEQQPEETQRRIIRQREARLQSITNKKARAEALHAALFRSWEEEKFKTWVVNCLLADLIKQFKLVKSATKKIGGMSVEESRRSQISLSVLRIAYPEICRVIALQKVASIESGVYAVEEESEGKVTEPLIIEELQSDKTKGDSSFDIDHANMADTQSLFEVVCRLLTAKLSHSSSCREMVGAIKYAQTYAAAKLSADDIVDSLSKEQYVARKRVIEIDTMKLTYKAVAESIRWLSEQIRLPLFSEWTDAAKQWVCIAILEKYEVEKPKRDLGKNVASSIIKAGYYGFKVRRVVQEIWRLADEELALEIENERILESQREDVSSSEINDVDPDRTEYDSIAKSSIILDIMDTSASGFSFVLEFSKILSATTWKSLKKVLICVGYETENLRKFSSDRSSSFSDFNEPRVRANLVLLVIDSRKDWGLPAGSACDVNLEWPRATSTSSTATYYCTISVRGLSAFTEYNTAIYLDSNLLKHSTLSPVDFSEAVSYKHHTSLLREVTVSTLAATPRAPEGLVASIDKSQNTFYSSKELYAPSSTIIKLSSVSVRLKWTPSLSNGSRVIKYELQRLKVINRSRPKSAPSSWKSICVLNVEEDSLHELEPVTTIAYTDMSIEVPFVFQYRVRACNSYGYGPYSAICIASSEDIISVTRNPKTAWPEEDRQHESSVSPASTPKGEMGAIQLPPIRSPLHSRFRSLHTREDEENIIL